MGLPPKWIALKFGWEINQEKSPNGFLRFFWYNFPDRCRQIDEALSMG
jgi:hypothetical protein